MTSSRWASTPAHARSVTYDVTRSRPSGTRIVSSRPASSVLAPGRCWPLMVLARIDAAFAVEGPDELREQVASAADRFARAT